MKSKKILSLIMALCVIGSSTVLLTDTAKASTVTNSDPSVTIVKPMTAGYVTITSTSGANVRSGPGTNYSIVGTANYGEVLEYNDAKSDSSGVIWYQVARKGIIIGWVSSQVSKWS